MSVVDEIKDSFRHGSSLTRIIYINLAVFVVYNLIRAILYLSGNPVGSSLAVYLAVPADFGSLIQQPWTVLTYMFFHEEFLHILFNMLWLYWFGQIFLVFLSQKKLTGVYLLGGISGALLFMIFYNLFPVFRNDLPVAIALGASASVLSIVVAISVLKPDYQINLLFIGPVKLKYLAVFSVVLDIISIPISNPGGHIAHLGGALFGYLYIIASRQGVDLVKPVIWISENIFVKRNTKSHLKVNYRKNETDIEYKARKVSEQQKLDKILDKISRTGYESLTKEEKEALFRMKDNSVN